MSKPLVGKLQELRNIPNTIFDDSDLYYTKRTVNKDNVKLEIEAEYQEVGDGEEYVVDKITYTLHYGSLYIEITEYDTDNFSIYISDGKNEFSGKYESDYGESLYFENDDDVIQLFVNIEQYVEDRIIQYLRMYESEIPKQLKDKIEDALKQI
jgi:hypothetical protein